MEEKKKGKGVKVFLVIFIILFLLTAGALGYGYTKYKDLKTENTNLNTKYENTNKDLEKVKSELDKINKELETAKKAEDESYGSEYAYRLKDISCELKDNVCTKSLKIKYNEKNHNIIIKKEVKFKRIKGAKDEDGNKLYDANYIYKIYEDDTLIDTIKVTGGSWGGTSNTSASADEVDFDGYIYVFNKKYLGILYSTVKGGYDLTLYNDSKRVDEVNVDVSGQGFSNKKGTVSDGLNNIKFDGSTLSYWFMDCKSYNKAVNLKLSFDGEKAKITSGAKEKATGGGSAGCYDTKTGTFKG